MTSVNQLFTAAAAAGAITPQAAAVLNIADLGAQMQQGLGVGVDDVPTTEAVIVSMLLDDSGSIHYARNEDALRQGANIVIESLRASKQRDSIIVLCRYLNGTVLYPYCPLDKAVPLDANNFIANGGTPLYDQTVVLLGSVLAKKQEFADAGVPARTVTLIVTDGHDEASTKVRSPSKVKTVIDSLSSETDIVAAMGIDDGHTDFRAIFREMGIRDRWILTPGSTPSEIRAAFGTFSQSAVRMSQAAPGAAAASVASGGFTV